MTKVRGDQIGQIFAYRGEGLAVIPREVGGHGSILNSGVTRSDFAELPPAFAERGLTGEGGRQ